MSPVRNIEHNHKHKKISNGVNIAVLASGKGSNFEAIVKAVNNGYIKAKIRLMVTDRPRAFVGKRAEKFKIKTVFINPKKYSSKLKFDKALLKILKAEKVELVVLAGYLRVLSAYFVKKYRNRILNIHPSLLPSFKGLNSIDRAFNYGSKLTGVTVHFVDSRIDHGPIILQDTVVIKKGMKLSSLEKEVHKLEHKLYPLAIKLFTERRLKVRGRIVAIK